MGEKGTRLIVQFLHSNPSPPKDPRGVLGRWWCALGWLTPEWLLWFAAIHQVTGGRGRGNIHQTAFVPDRCAKTLLPCALSSKIGFKRCVCVCVPGSPSLKSAPSHDEEEPPAACLLYQRECAALRSRVWLFGGHVVLCNSSPSYKAIQDNDHGHWSQLL